MVHELWELVGRQHGVISREQLLGLGFTRAAIQHWLQRGLLHPLWRGVYAVGRPDVTREGRWLAATLACGRDARLSHGSAATLRGLGEYERGVIEVSIPSTRRSAHSGIRVYRRAVVLAPEICRGIPLTPVAQTLIDLSGRLSARQLETAVNEAVKLDLTTPDDLRRELDDWAGTPGIPKLRRILDVHRFRLTDSELERIFLPLAARAGLPLPETRRVISGFRVDFYWPSLGLVVETDGLRFHRTPAEQARDRLRDQVLTAAGLTVLRFTHRQVRYDSHHVERILRGVVNRLAGHSEQKGSRAA